MQQILTPYSRHIEHWVWWDNLFDYNELNTLQTWAKQGTFEAQVGGGNGATNNKVRRTKLNWVEKNNETWWVYERLAVAVSKLNAQFFNFDLTGFGEHLQLANYESADTGMYGWHIDMGSEGPCRKLSVVLQLSDPSEYEGGSLELQPYNAEIIRPQKRRGLLVAFPSWTLHQVTPVTQGSRQSLVAWISGPPFK
jgi:PKHD-type hydroxylase